jgi:phage-related protein
MTMGLLDGLLGQVGGVDQIAGLAAKVGLSEEQVKSAMAALGQSHAAPGDTVAGAAAATGLPTDKLKDLVSQIGGEGALGKISSMIDRDGDGNPLNDLSGIVGSLFGKK